MDPVSERELDGQDLTRMISQASRILGLVVEFFDFFPVGPGNTSRQDAEKLSTYRQICFLKNVWYQLTGQFSSLPAEFFVRLYDLLGEINEIDFMTREEDTEERSAIIREQAI